jgi:hypothetical protein
MEVAAAAAIPAPIAAAAIATVITATVVAAAGVACAAIDAAAIDAAAIIAGAVAVPAAVITPTPVIAAAIIGIAVAITIADGRGDVTAVAIDARVVATREREAEPGDERANKNPSANHVPVLCIANAARSAHDRA